MEKTKHYVSCGTTATSIENHIFIVNSFYPKADAPALKEKVFTIIENKAIRTFATAKK
ncbi:MAG: hypothetical protein LBL67_05100 [Coriobacteriales bacterium]|jgi:hypothetical protein|nr:hypothetical protein [Coriobacteriales bacterium]